MHAPAPVDLSPSARACRNAYLACAPSADGTRWGRDHAPPEATARRRRDFVSRQSLVVVGGTGFDDAHRFAQSLTLHVEWEGMSDPPLLEARQAAPVGGREPGESDRACGRSSSRLTAIGRPTNAPCTRVTVPARPRRARRGAMPSPQRAAHACPWSSVWPRTWCGSITSTCRGVGTPMLPGMEAAYGCRLASLGRGALLAGSRAAVGVELPLARGVPDVARLAPLVVRAPRCFDTAWRRTIRRWCCAPRRLSPAACSTVASWSPWATGAPAWSSGRGALPAGQRVGPRPQRHGRQAGRRAGAVPLRTVLAGGRGRPGKGERSMGPEGTTQTIPLAELRTALAVPRYAESFTGEVDARRPR